MMGALRYHYFHLYRQGVLLQDFDQQPYQDDCDDVPCCPHYPSRRVADGDDAVGDGDDGDDGDDNMVDSKDTPNPSSRESPNHNTNSYSNSSRMDYSHSNHSSRNGMGHPNRSTSHK